MTKAAIHSNLYESHVAVEEYVVGVLNGIVEVKPVRTQQNRIILMIFLLPIGRRMIMGMIVVDFWPNWSIKKLHPKYRAASQKRNNSLHLHSKAKNLTSLY